jgi:Domain of unknown function (DUF4396)
MKMNPGHSHEHIGHQHQMPSITHMAVTATVHCLIGCSIGEALGLALATTWGWDNTASITLAVVLAFLFGYGFTLYPLLRSGMTLPNAAGIAFAADTISIAIMEVVDNAVMLLIPGAMQAGVGDVLFWVSLVFSLFAAFLAALPVNRWLIAHGRGHAVVHSHHH